VKPFHSQKKGILWDGQKCNYYLYLSQNEHSPLDINQAIRHLEDASCYHLSISTILFYISINHFNNPTLKTQMFNICRNIFSLWNTTKISLNFNSMKIYSHGFVVPTLEYKISIFILNLFLVPDLQQTFYNPKNKWNTIWTTFLGHSSLLTLEITFFGKWKFKYYFSKGS